MVKNVGRVHSLVLNKWLYKCIRRVGGFGIFIWKLKGILIEIKKNNKFIIFWFHWCRCNDAAFVASTVRQVSAPICVYLALMKAKVTLCQGALAVDKLLLIPCNKFLTLSTYAHSQLQAIVAIFGVKGRVDTPVILSYRN